MPRALLARRCPSLPVPGHGQAARSGGGRAGGGCWVGALDRPRSSATCDRGKRAPRLAHGVLAVAAAVPVQAGKGGKKKAEELARKAEEERLAALLEEERLERERLEREEEEKVRACRACVSVCVCASVYVCVVCARVCVCVCVCVRVRRRHARHTRHMCRRAPRATDPCSVQPQRTAARRHT